MRIESYLSEAHELKMFAAVLLYASTEKGADRTITLATLNSVILDPVTKGPMIMTGQAIERTRFLEIANQLAGSGSDTETRNVLPESVLYSNTDVLAWYRPPSVRRIYVETENKTFNANVNGRPVPHPGLVFLATCRTGKSDLYIWAYDGEGRPEPATRLYRAPYFNLYATGHLCEGTFQLPRSLNLDAITHFESAFFETNFAHTNVEQGEICRHRHGHHAMWTELARRETVRQSVRSRLTRKRHTASGFPNRYLVALQGHDGTNPMTLQEALDGA